MQTMIFSLALAAMSLAPMCAAVSPIAKVVEMLSDLNDKIVKEGEVAQAEYEKFANWCEDRSRDLVYEIKTGKGSQERLTASIAKDTAFLGSLQVEVEELAATISKNDGELAAATKLRNKEEKDFKAEEKEVMELIDSMERATTTLEKEMQGGSSMVQLQNAQSLSEALAVMVRASLIGTEDADALTALVQSSQKADDDEGDGGGDGEEDAGAPAASTYKTHSGGIVDTLEDLTEKAESQLSDVRKKESTASFNYQKLKQAFEFEIKHANTDLAEAKKSIASSSESKSSAEGDLGIVGKELKEDTKAKSVLHRDCMSKAEAFETQTKGRGEELKAITSARKTLSEMSQASSFLQLGRSRLHEPSRGIPSEVFHVVRDLARRQHSRALVQLASQIAAAADGADPFEKVKKLLSGMIERLEDAAGEDAQKKAYCDKEMAEARAKKEDRSEKITKLSTRIEQSSSKSAMLKEEVAMLGAQLSKLSKSQAQMDQLRREETAEFETAKADLEQGLQGVKSALKVLSEYYATGNQDNQAQGASGGAASGIIALLEVIEADLSKSLTEATSDEDAAVAEYEKTTEENKIEKAQKDQDVKYKTRESKELDTTMSEQTSDRLGVSDEFSAVTSYLTKLEDACIAKPSTYEKRKKSREAEIQGLKEALDVLEGETALVQKRTVHRTLRGGRPVAVRPHRVAA